MEATAGQVTESGVHFATLTLLMTGIIIVAAGINANLPLSPARLNQRSQLATTA